MSFALDRSLPAEPTLASVAPGGSGDVGQGSAAGQAGLRFDALADAIDHMIWSTRPDGFHDYYNSRWLEFTGAPQGRNDDGDSWKSCVHPDDLAGMEQTWSWSLRTGAAYEAEFRLRHVSGQYRWMIARARPARDAAGLITRWYGSCTDIHDLKSAQHELSAKETQLREWNEKLEQRVAARTSELVDAQAALRQSQKLDSMGQITGGVAHDLNNLLTPIFGGLDVIRRSGFGAHDQRMQRLISGALASAERARILVQRMLAFSRRQPLNPLPVKVNEMIGDLRQILEMTLAPGIETRIDVPASLPYVRADAHQLEVAILNIVVNAREAMPDGGVLRIGAELVFAKLGQYPGVSPGFYVRLRVADTGCGMDADTLVRAVEPFFTTKKEARDAGLGLSMAHGLAAQLGGLLTIDSAPREGTIVSILLPTADCPFVEAPEPRAAAAAVAPGRILLADDEQDVRASVAQLFESFGQEVVEASTAREAMALLESGEHFDLVVTDHLMPGMSGVELIRHIRANWPEQKLLIVSGHPDIDQFADGIPHLPKPFRHADLARILPTLLPREAA